MSTVVAASVVLRLEDACQTVFVSTIIILLFHLEFLQKKVLLLHSLVKTITISNIGPETFLHSLQIR